MVYLILNSLFVIAETVYDVWVTTQLLMKLNHISNIIIVMLNTLTFSTSLISVSELTHIV